MRFVDPQCLRELTRPRTQFADILRGAPGLHRFDALSWFHRPDQNG